MPVSAKTAPPGVRISGVDCPTAIRWIHFPSPPISPAFANSTRSVFRHSVKPVSRRPAVSVEIVEPWNLRDGLLHPVYRPSPAAGQIRQWSTRTAPDSPSSWPWKEWARVPRWRDSAPWSCQGGATCIDGIGGYSCICPAGRHGVRCEICKFCFNN